MRGSDVLQENLFMVTRLEDFVPVEHPLRAIRLLLKKPLTRLNGLFRTCFADTGHK